MQTQLADEFQGTPEGETAERVLRKCVHCGFCTATCPTYQVLGDELDGPRGRIYLMKQVFEGAPVTRKTQAHLDRCLTCRNCESTCPSGVPYAELLEVGRRVVDAKVQRPLGERLQRDALRKGLTSPLFAPAIQLGRLVRPLMPAKLQAKITPKPPASAQRWPQRTHARRVLMLTGCVQPALMPNINAATARVLDAAGIQTVVAEAATCCGAIKGHLNDHEGSLADMRRNIDAWWPSVEGLKGGGRVEAIVMNASGCGVTVKEYGKALAHDPTYADKARRISELTRDLSELLADLAPRLQPKLDRSVRGQALVFHPPCTLQHGQQLRGGVEQHLRSLGFEVRLASRDAHLCCGSAGTYSVLQPTMATTLRDRKLEALAPNAQETIISANIGCIQHLQSGTETPVRHWIEVLDDALV